MKALRTGGLWKRRPLSGFGVTKPGSRNHETRRTDEALGVEFAGKNGDRGSREFDPVAPHSRADHTPAL